jgi:hypothetical protein
MILKQETLQIQSRSANHLTAVFGEENPKRRELHNEVMEMELQTLNTETGNFVN